MRESANEMVADEFQAADTFYYFPEPTFYRLPANTDELFKRYISNPDDYEEFEIPKEFLGQRYTDLKGDLHQITGEASSPNTVKKYHFYRGVVHEMGELFQKANNNELGQSELAERYNGLERTLNLLRSLGQSVGGTIQRYYYYKGQQTILKQLILNTPLLQKNVA